MIPLDVFFWLMMAFYKAALLSFVLCLIFGIITGSGKLIELGIVIAVLCIFTGFVFNVLWGLMWAFMGGSPMVVALWMM